MSLRELGDCCTNSEMRIVYLSFLRLENSDKIYCVVSFTVIKLVLKIFLNKLREEI